MFKKYLVKTYDPDGDYIGLVNKYDFNSFTEKINSGQGELDLTVKQDIKDFDLSGKYGFFNEVRIDYKDQYTGSTGARLYSGKIIEIEPQDQALKLTSAGYVSDLANRRLQKSVNGVQYSIGSDQTSDIIKDLIINYRAQFSSVSVSEKAPTELLDSTFGGTRWLGQKFTTTGLTSEERIITGVRVRLKYNAGTAADIGCYLYTSVGLGVPGAAVTNIAQGSSISNSSYGTFDFYFDAPYTMSATTDYFVVLNSTASSATNTYQWSTDLDYYAGGYKVHFNGLAWAADPTLDMSFELLYADESRVKINYTSTSIDDSEDAQTLKIQLDTYKQVIDRAVKYGPANWYWFIDQNNTFHYHRYGLQSMEVNDCDNSAIWTSSGCTLSTETNNIKEGEGAVSIALSGLGASSTALYSFGIGSIDISSYKYSAPIWFYIPNLSGIDYVACRYYDGLVYDEFRIESPALTTGWNYLLDKVNIRRTPDASTGTVDYTQISIIQFRIEQTAAATATAGFIIDDWRAANLNHHNLFWQKDWDLETKFDVRELKNDFLFYNNQTGGSQIISQYKNQDSIDTHGRYHSQVSDERVTTQATADLRGYKEILEKSNPRTIIEGVTVKAPFNFPQIKPGHTVSIKNVPSNYQNLVEDRMVTMEKAQNHNNCGLTLTRETPIITRQIDKLTKKDEDITTTNLPDNFS